MRHLPRGWVWRSCRHRPLEGRAPPLEDTAPMSMLRLIAEAHELPAIEIIGDKLAAQVAIRRNSQVAKFPSDLGLRLSHRRSSRRVIGRSAVEFRKNRPFRAD